MAHNLPLGLLEEIRNHHHLAPGAASQRTYRKTVPAQDKERRPRPEPKFKPDEYDQDEDSDREHISSATYYPHQGLAVRDSPKGEQLLEYHHDVKTPMLKKQESDDVDIALRSENAEDYLRGDISLSRPSSTADFEKLPKPLFDEKSTSDSDYESYSEGYDTATSEQEQTTPTGTPWVEDKMMKRSPKERNTHQPSPPIGAVELKPYRHQVGGHTTVYRFSRRAVCKQLNSKENMFYEIIERRHPELLGFMPRYIGVLNVTYRKEQKKRKRTLSELGVNARAGSNVSADATNQSNNKDEARDAQTNRPDHQRIVSHSQQQPSAIPQVIFENNRHLIPESLFGLPRRSITPDLQKSRWSPPSRPSGKSDDETSGSGYRPYLKSKAHSSWGYTTVNEHPARQSLEGSLLSSNNTSPWSERAGSSHKLTPEVSQVCPARPFCTG